MIQREYEDRGWVTFKPDNRLRKWLAHATPVAIQTTKDPRNIKDWLRCQGTWFAGVQVLPNDADGRVANSAPLACDATDLVLELMGLSSVDWDRAQISVCYPGYPKPRKNENVAASKYRRDRDAAHVDGLHPVGEQKRRHLIERHAFILGIPLTKADQNAAPLVVWDGSHKIFREMFKRELDGIEPDDWSKVDLTDTYQKTRLSVFDKCKRSIVHVDPGEAYVVNRFSLHGVAPWVEGAEAETNSRAICYFRPIAKFSGADWLEIP